MNAFSGCCPAKLSLNTALGPETAGLVGVDVRRSPTRATPRGAWDFMTLLIIAASAVAIASFALGWFRGYKKACDAHDWNLPKVDWKSDPKRPYRQ